MNQSRPSSDDYFGYHPRLLLSRPVLLLGFFGARQARVAQWLGCLTGLPCHDLERLSEHELGCTRAAALLEGRAEQLQRVEEEMLERTLRSQPAGILVSGDGALFSIATIRALGRRARAIYLRQPLSASYWAVRQDYAQLRARYFPAIRSQPSSAQELSALLLAREPAYREATHTMDIQGLAPRSVADRLLGMLPRD